MINPILSLKIIKQIYTSYVHSVLNYGIIFWGYSSYSGTICNNTDKNCKNYHESQSKGFLSGKVQ